jgi:hypothetical protein
LVAVTVDGLPASPYAPIYVLDDHPVIEEYQTLVLA